MVITALLESHLLSANECVLIFESDLTWYPGKGGYTLCPGLFGHILVYNHEYAFLRIAIVWFWMVLLRIEMDVLAVSC